MPRKANGEINLTAMENRLQGNERHGRSFEDHEARLAPDRDPGQLDHSGKSTRDLNKAAGTCSRRQTNEVS